MMLAPQCSPETPPDFPNFPALPVAGATTPRAALPGRNILVVDDELDIRETLDLLLSQAQYQVTTADSGPAAVAAARKSHFDLLITDLRMPGMSGAETITVVKQVAPAIRVIVATGFPSEDSAADCRRRGANAFLQKPFEIKELLRIVSGLLNEPA